MKLVRLDEYRNREVAAVLRELAQLADRGQIRGLAFVAKIGRRGHRPGLVGDYRRCPDEALAATVRLQETLLKDDPEIDAGAGI